MMRADKIEFVKKLAAQLEEADAIVLTNFKGIKYPQLDHIRQSIKAAGSDFKVVKNTLLKKALEANDIDALHDQLDEPTALVVVKGDVAATAKELKKFNKENKNFIVKAGMMSGSVLDGADIDRIAELPSREELLAKALGSMNAPVQNFVLLLANIPRSFLYALNAIKQQKEDKE